MLLGVRLRRGQIRVRVRAEPELLEERLLVLEVLGQAAERRLEGRPLLLLDERAERGGAIGMLVVHRGHLHGHQVQARVDKLRIQASAAAVAACARGTAAGRGAAGVGAGLALATAAVPAAAVRAGARSARSAAASGTQLADHRSGQRHGPPPHGARHEAEVDVGAVHLYADALAAFQLRRLPGRRVEDHVLARADLGQRLLSADGVQ
mmetsp:Transcript_178138/g.571019  ORF Transcript_178138/g.571019 Transcript_178138/m.571019 type:complete len:208 (+) Transcript_178138:192-815(+)